MQHGNVLIACFLSGTVSPSSLIPWDYPLRYPRIGQWIECSTKIPVTLFRSGPIWDTLFKCERNYYQENVRFFLSVHCKLLLCSLTCCFFYISSCTYVYLSKAFPNLSCEKWRRLKWESPTCRSIWLWSDNWLTLQIPNQRCSLLRSEESSFPSPQRGVSVKLCERRAFFHRPGLARFFFSVYKNSKDSFYNSFSLVTSQWCLGYCHCDLSHIFPVTLSYLYKVRCLTTSKVLPRQPLLPSQNFLLDSLTYLFAKYLYLSQ